jgi:hypothetical protein
MSKEFLYLRLGLAVILVLGLWSGAALRAMGQMPQLKRPEPEAEKQPEAKKPKKKVKGPRAVGLLQLNSAGKGTLIPIAILVDGKFYDASLYKADPIPMALETGTVYEVEQTGESQGLFTVNGALHSKEGDSAQLANTHSWRGAGAFLPRGTEVAATTRKAENVPVGMDTGDSDAPPRLTRGNSQKSEPSDSSKAAPASNVPAGTGGSGTEAPAAQKTNGASDGSAAKTPAEQGAAPAAAPSPTTAQSSGTKQGSKDEGTNQQDPTGVKAGVGQEKAQEQPPKSGEPESYYRPRLRRGKPTEGPPAVDELAAKVAKLENGTATTSVANAGPLKLLPAISDDGGPDPRTYKFFWKTGEEDERRGQMLVLATEEIKAYANALAKNTIPAKVPAVKTPVSRQKASAKAVQPVFENTQFQAFDVWGNNQAVMILSTEAHFPPTAGATKAPESYSVTILARTDIYGNLRKIYSGVTDKFHLDVTPRLELIDAVDADGDGRGELLFRETTDAGNGYVIYRATADKLWKMFDSLGEK